MSTAGHRLIALLLVLLLAAAGYQLFKVVWLGRYHYYQTALGQLQDRLQRYNRLLAGRAAITAELAQVRKSSSTDAYYLHQTSPPLAATELQQRISRLIDSSNGSLVSSQILPASKDHGFTRVAVRIQLTGDIKTLQKTFYSLESQQPMLFIDDVQIRARTIRRRIPPQRGPNGRLIQPAQPYYTEVQILAEFEVSGYMQKG